MSSEKCGEGGEDIWACRKPAPLSISEKEEILNAFPLADRASYFGLSSFPITRESEQFMEHVSLVVTKEDLAGQWDVGRYACSRCNRPLYHSGDKFQGPCMWPSFRKPCSPEALHERPVSGYNKYSCDTREIYCGKEDCRLFLGHMFEDGKETGDANVDAQWRHCVLSMSLRYTAE